MKATVEQLQAAIARERAYQDAKWGTVKANPHNLAGWRYIAGVRLQKAIKSADDRVARAELLQMVAVCEACFEQWALRREMDLDDLKSALSVAERASGEASPRSLNEWLVDILKPMLLWVQFLITGGQIAEARLKFIDFMGAGRAALLQHGIVERGDL